MKPSSHILVVLSFFCAFSLGFSEHEEDFSFNDCEKPKDSDKSLGQKIKRIQIPQLNLFNTPLPEAMKLLSAQSRKLDSKETNPDAKGVNIIVLDQGAPAPSLTIKLNKMSLDKTLDFITEMVGWTYEVRKDAIVVMKEPRGGLGFAQGLKLEFFEVPQDIINRMTGAGAGVPPDPFIGVPKKIDPSGKMKQYLTNAGVIFDERKGHRFIFDGFQIIATHEQEALDRIRAILLSLDDKVTRQIETQFKILEVPLGALGEALEKAIGPRLTKGQGHVQLESRLAGAIFADLKKMDGVVLKSLPRLVVMDGQPASFETGEEMIYPTDFIPPKPVASAGGKPDQPFAPIPQFDTVAPDDEQPGFRMVGTRIELTARHEPKYDRVTVELAKKITELKGFDEYGAGTKVPKFWAWRLNTSVILKRSHAMIFRGPASDEKREIIIFLEAKAAR